MHVTKHGLLLFLLVIVLTVSAIGTGMGWTVHGVPTRLDIALPVWVPGFVASVVQIGEFTGGMLITLGGMLTFGIDGVEDWLQLVFFGISIMVIGLIISFVAPTGSG